MSSRRLLTARRTYRPGPRGEQGEASSNNASPELEDSVRSHDSLSTDPGRLLEILEYQPPACSTWVQDAGVWRVVSFVVGVGLVIAGSIEETRTGTSGSKVLARALLIPGCGLALFLVVSLLLVLVERGLSALLGRSKVSWDTIASLLFSVSATRPRLEWITWSLVFLGVFLALVPRDSDLTIQTEWELAHFHTIRLLVLIALLNLFKVLTFVIRSRFALYVRNQSYAEQVRLSLYHEHAINSLCQSEPRPLFASIHNRLMTTSSGGVLEGYYAADRDMEDADSSPLEGHRHIDPLFWQSLMRYVGRQHVDGSRLGSREDHGTTDAATTRRLADRVSQHIFVKLFALTNANRALQAHPPSPAQGALAQVDVVVGNEPSYNDSTRSGTASVGSTGSRGSGHGRNAGAHAPTWLARLENRIIERTDFLGVAGELLGIKSRLNPEMVWQLLDPPGTGKIKLRSLRRAVDDIFRTRRNLAITLFDAQSVMLSLDSFIMSAFYIILALTGLALYNINVVELWLSLSASLLSFSFVFGNSVRTAFEVLLWIFFVNPYSTGDQIEVNGERYEVQRVHLYSTQLVHWTGAVVVMQNSTLMGHSIANFTTADNVSAVCRVKVDMDIVSPGFMSSMRAGLRVFFETHRESFATSDWRFELRDIQDEYKVSLALVYSHAYPAVSLRRVFVDQDTLYEHLVTLLCQHGARYSGLGVGVYPVNSSGEERPTPPPPARDVESVT